MKYCFLVALTLLCFSSCAKKKEQALVYHDDESVEDTTMSGDDVGESVDSTAFVSHGDEVLVPFEVRGGVKYLDVSINGGITVKMVLDSGCSDALISVAEANYLYQKGVFTASDILGVGQSQIADGSIVENMVVNLREVVIGGKIVCHNVRATVSENSDAPLLMGNDVLDRATSYEVDNVNQVIRFRIN